MPKVFSNMGSIQYLLHKFKGLNNILFSITCPLREGSADFSGSSIVIDDFGNDWPPSVDSFNASTWMFLFLTDFTIKELND